MKDKCINESFFPFQKTLGHDAERGDGSSGSTRRTQCVIPGARINRAHGHRYRRKVTDVHVEFGSHREDVAGSIPEELQSSHDDPVRLTGKAALEEAQETHLFATFEVVCILPCTRRGM